MESATPQLKVNAIADGNLRPVVQDVSCGIGGDGVTSLHDLERAALVELPGKTLPTFALLTKQPFGANSQIVILRLQTQAQRRHRPTKVE